MAEYTAVAAQTVQPNGNVLLTETPICGGKCITHREGAGVITLRGITNQCRARYRVTFGGNIALPTGGTLGGISLAIAVQGEPLPSTVMIETPAAVNEYGNVSASVFIDVPQGCCVPIGSQYEHRGGIGRKREHYCRKGGLRWN